MSRLTTTQVEDFHREGYLIIEDIFDPADLEPVRREFERRIDEEARTLHAAGQLAELHADADFDHRLGLIYRDDPAAARAIIRGLEGNAGGGHTGREMYRVLVHAKLLAAVECLVGPEIVASSVYRVRPKLPHYARGVVPWHQDSGYFEPLCDRHLVLTCWVPLVDATPANGCMQILPRVHDRGILPHHTGGNAGFLVINDGDLPSAPDRAVSAPCRRGGVVFMTNLTPHCSTENHTDAIRWSLDLRYQSAAVPNNASLLPAPGLAKQDQSFQIACYAPEADFVVQSRQDPGRVASFEEYQRRRQRFDAAARAGSIAYPQRGWTPVAAN